MKNAKTVVLAAMLAAGCGSEWHLPGENITMPSSVELNARPVQKPEDVGSSDRKARRVPPTTFPVFAHYMSWATVPGGWSSASVMPIRRDNPGGGYTSANADIIRQHNTEMQANGVLPMISWWARDTYAGDAFLDVYLSIPGPQIGILYEAVGPGRMQINGNSSVMQLASQFGPPTNAYEQPLVSRMAILEAAQSSCIDVGSAFNRELFISDMVHLQAKYFNRFPDRFYRIDGRPVVFVWVTGAFCGPFDQVVAAARTAGASFYLMGSDFNVPMSVGPGQESVVRGMDAVSSYGFYDPRAYGADLDEKFIRDFDLAVGAWDAWLTKNSPHTKLLLPMGFAYDDSLIPGRRGMLYRSSFEIARKYAKIVREKIANPCGSGRILPVAYITSYNEHYEGTSIEPSREYGDNYLRIIRDTFAAPQAAESPVENRREACGDDRRDGDRNPSH